MDQGADPTESGFGADEFLKIWNEKMPTCENDYSRTRREVKAYWVSLFVGSLGVITNGDWKR